MAKYRIEHDREKCIGCGACASVCPDNWEMAADGKSRCKKTELEEIGCNQQAADGCPEKIIHITEIKEPAAGEEPEEEGQDEAEEPEEEGQDEAEEPEEEEKPAQA